MEEGEEFEQVESRQLGIAEPVAGQRRAEQQVRRPRHRRNRLTAPDALHAPARIGQPDADMARMDRGQGKRIGRHGPMLGTKEERGQMKQAPPLFRGGASKASAQPPPSEPQDRKSVVSGKSVSVRVTPGGRRLHKKKKQQ